MELAQLDLLPFVSVIHGVVQWSVVFLAGLVAFTALVWLPATSKSSVAGELGPPVARWVWFLVGVLVASGVAELCLYAVRASGEGLTPRLFTEALFATRVGHIWAARLMLGLLVALSALVAVRSGRTAYWWAATALGAGLLMTLTFQSHAAAEDRLLPFVADWVHVMAAAPWMGGLLGFPIALAGPLRGMRRRERAQVLGRVVRRFSKVATAAVILLGVTGVYAILLHVPEPAALASTPYGRALIMKLGLLTLLLAAGGINFADRGEGPFGRMVAAELVLAFGIFIAVGFLSSVAPATSSFTH